MNDVGLVSVVMLSHNKGKYVRETMESVLAQTYQNWEIVFMDDNSKDDTISQIMHIRQEVEQGLSSSKGRGASCVPSVASDQRSSAAGSATVNRIHVLQNVMTKGLGSAVNSALRDARGRWIAFLNVGDVWEPTKLEKQLAFMTENGYAFSYTKFGLMNEQSESRGVIVGGKAHVTYDDMQRCCWPSYLTVMYDAEKVGKMKVKNPGWNNDYSLWLNVCEKADCYLLDENLATLRTRWNTLGRMFLNDKMKWRYEVYRKEKGLDPVMSGFYTIRNMWYGLVKWWRYVEKCE